MARSRDFMQIALVNVQRCGISISFYALPALLYFWEIAISCVLEEFHLVCELWSNRHVQNDRVLILLLWEICEHKQYDCVLQRKLGIFMKTNFFIWSRLRFVFTGFCSCAMSHMCIFCTLYILHMDIAISCEYRSQVGGAGCIHNP